MTNKTLGTLIIISFVCALVAMVVESDFPGMGNSLYVLSGFGYLIFGTWAGFRLMK